nr:MAG TPA: hypothetical protein [Caudoviricetes sp.]
MPRIYAGAVLPLNSLHRPRSMSSWARSLSFTSRMVSGSYTVT